MLPDVVQLDQEYDLPDDRGQKAEVGAPEAVFGCGTVAEGAGTPVHCQVGYRSAKKFAENRADVAERNS